MSSRHVTIGTWMYGEPEGEESFYPAVGGNTSAPSFQAVYWRCVATFFATSARQNPHAHHVLFTNFEQVPRVDGFDLAALLARLGVETVRLPFTYLPPEGYFGSWRNQFYIFDIIHHLAGRLAPDDTALVLDSDCVWVRPADEMVGATAACGLLTYEVAYPEGMDVHGLSRRDMGALYRDLLGADWTGTDEPVAVPAAPPYHGGELFAATGRAVQQVAERIDPLWDEMLGRFRRGAPKFNEEAQALSFLYHALGYPGGTADPFIRRIWTTLFRSEPALPSDQDLTLWHLPAEKRYGIRYLFEGMKRERSRFWTTPLGEPFRAYLGRQLGVPRRTPQKLIRDTASGLAHKLGQGLSR